MAIVLDGSSAAGVLNLGTNGTITNLAEGGLPDGKVTSADLKSTSGTAGASTYYRGDQTWGTITSEKGVEEYDEWRLHTTFDPNATGWQILTSNWERNDTGFSVLGTGMTQSSGVFTFPSTGIWYLECVVGYVVSSQMRYCAAGVDLTTDNGSNWVIRAQPYSGRDACSPNGFIYARSSCGFDVTDTSQCKARMKVTSSVSSAACNAATDQNYTYMTFRKYGET